MSKTDFKITPATPEDLSGVVRLWKEQYDYHYKLDPVYYAPFTGDLGGKVKDDLLKQLSKDEPHLLVARKDDRLIGFITFGVDEDSYYDANITKFGVVKEVLVTEEFRGLGVGAGLIKEVEDHFRSHGIKNMVIQCSSFNRNALAVYDRLGYQIRQELLYKTL